MARFLPDSGLLIQHCPRTGGSFVERSIDELGIRKVRWVSKQPEHLPKKHSLLSHYNREAMRQVRYIACFVREPVAYYRSVWCWLAGAGEQKRERLLRKWSWHPHAIAARLFDERFEIWVERLLDQEPAWATRLFESYVGPEGGEFCSFIGRCENLSHDLCRLLHRAGYDFDPESVRALPQQNESKVPRPDVSPWLEGEIKSSERVAYRRWYGDGKDRRFYGDWSK